MPIFLTPQYWLTLKPPLVTEGIGLIFFVIMIAAFVAGLVIRLVSTKHKNNHYLRQIYSRFGSLFTTMGLIGLFLIFLSFENIRFLGARFWYLIWLVFFLLWLYFIIRFIKKDIPEIKRKDKEKEERDKYLPRRNTR